MAAANKSLALGLWYTLLVYFYGIIRFKGQI